MNGTIEFLDHQKHNYRPYHQNHHAKLFSSKVMINKSCQKRTELGGWVKICEEPPPIKKSKKENEENVLLQSLSE